MFANGETIFKVKGTHAKVSVIWNFQAPEGAGDTHYSMMRGTKANLVIRQGAEQGYKPALYVELKGATEEDLAAAIGALQTKYPGIGYQQNKNGLEVLIPDSFKNGHEAHFAQVTEKFLEYLAAGKLPDWEVPNMLAKYYVTTEAYKLSR